MKSPPLVSWLLLCVLNKGFDNDVDGADGFIFFFFVSWLILSLFLVSMMIISKCNFPLRCKITFRLEIIIRKHVQVTHNYPLEGPWRFQWQDLRLSLLFSRFLDCRLSTSVMMISDYSLLSRVKVYFLSQLPPNGC